jgi:hypothetical protein
MSPVFFCILTMLLTDVNGKRKKSSWCLLFDHQLYEILIISKCTSKISHASFVLSRLLMFIGLDCVLRLMIHQISMKKYISNSAGDTRLASSIFFVYGSNTQIVIKILIMFINNLSIKTFAFLFWSIFIESCITEMSSIISYFEINSKKNLLWRCSFNGYLSYWMCYECFHCM